MRVSIIIAIYKDLEALQLIIDSLKRQPYTDFEVIVAEDNNSQEVSDYIKSISDLDVSHTTQEDIAIRKSRSQNNAILKSTGEYLIFIDGDCVLYKDFINSHVYLSGKGTILAGRRVNLGPIISKLIRKKLFKPALLEKLYLILLPLLLIDRASHATQGIFFKPSGWLYKTFILNRKKTGTNILGCNFSCFRDDFIKINGFDESYGETAVPDDTDIQWRFEAAGLRIKSCKLAANEFHLYHVQRSKASNLKSMQAKMRDRKDKGDFIAEIGLTSHTTSD